MTKSEIVSEISKQTRVEKSEALKIVEVLMETVKDSLEDDKNIYFRGFGSFVVKQRAAKTARNISKNTSVVIPAHKIPFFKPAKPFINKVKLGNK